jgi:hypothetical protein
MIPVEDSDDDSETDDSDGGGVEDEDNGGSEGEGGGAGGEEEGWIGEEPHPQRVTLGLVVDWLGMKLAANKGFDIPTVAAAFREAVVEAKG